MDTNQIMAIGQQGIYVILDRLQKNLEEIEDKRKKDKQESNIAIDEVKDTARKAVDIAVSAKAIKSNMAGYMNASAFGSMFINKVGAKRVGQLLKIIGVAQKSNPKTIPYDTCVPKYSKIDFVPDIYGRDQPAYRWNYDNCKEKLDDWLLKYDLYEEFYTVNSNGKLDRYIKILYERFKNKEFDS